MPAARTNERLARSGGWLVAASLVACGALGCGGKTEYAPDANDHGAWLGGSVPADSTVLSRGRAPGAPAAEPTAPAVAPPVVDAPPKPATPPASAGGNSASSAVSSPSTKSSAPSGSYKVVEVKGCGSIHVVCRLDKPAEIETVVAFKDQMQGCTDHKSERCRYVRKGDGDLRLGNCVVFLRSIREGKDWPEPLRGDDRTYVIDQKACVYVPHVGWTRPNTQVVVANSDRADHNIHGNRGSDTKFNFSSEPDTRKDSIGEAFLEIADEYFVKCDIHPWMNAYIQVVAHPYYAITPEADGPSGPAGEVVLEDVPPGTYEVVCWHEGMISTIQMMNGVPSGFNYTPGHSYSEPASVTAGGRVEVTFTVPYK